MITSPYGTPPCSPTFSKRERCHHRDRARTALGHREATSPYWAHRSPAILGEERALGIDGFSSGPRRHGGRESTVVRREACITRRGRPAPGRNAEGDRLKCLLKAVLKALKFS